MQTKRELNETEVKYQGALQQWGEEVKTLQKEKEEQARVARETIAQKDREIKHRDEEIKKKETSIRETKDKLKELEKDI